MALSKLQLSELLSIYGDLLTGKQREAVSMYCDCDCSLAEIANETGISRQGVRDAIIKSEAALVKFESTIHLARLIKDLSKAISSDDDKELKEIAIKFISKE